MNNEKVPNLIIIILISTLVAAMGGRIGGTNLTGLAWFIPLSLSVYLLVQNKFKVAFPVWVWLPWALVILFNFLRLNYVNSMQRAIMLICPIVVGAAISTINFNEAQVKNYISILRKFCVVLFIIILFKTEIIFTFRLPNRTALAAEVMIGIILISLFSTTYFSGNKKDGYLVVGLLLVPVIAVTRMAMLSTAICLPLNFSKVPLIKRATFILGIFIAGMFVLNSERVQKKMFFQNPQGKFQKQDMFELLSKEGFNFYDAIKNNPQISTSGRSFMWDMVSRNAAGSPLFGKGIGACEDFVKRITYGGAGYPHNDWLLTYYDMGMVGVIALALSLILATGHCLLKGIKSEGVIKILFLSMAFSFVPFCLMMITDNILVYASFFGNFQFCTMGIAYAALKAKKNAEVK